MSEERTALRSMVNQYQPEWHYSMGKVGYECSFCRVLVASASEFNRPEHHNPHCSFIAAMRLLDMLPAKS